MSDQLKYFLEESKMPKTWYNIAADLPKPMEPPLHPGTLKPIGPDDLAPLFPMALIGQEVSQDREIETVMVRATAVQQQCYYVDVNSVGEQGCGQSIACDPEGNVLHISNDQEDIFTIQVDFDFVRNSRKNGIMGLGQNLKSYRDNPFSSMIKDKRNNNYLESLGALTQLKKEDD